MATAILAAVDDPRIRAPIVPAPLEIFPEPPITCVASLQGTTFSIVQA
jgi:hypothetical protein